MMTFYAPVWHGFSWANLTLAALGVGSVAWMLYWRFVSRAFDPKPISWRAPRVDDATLRSTLPMGVTDVQSWRDSRGGPR